MGLGAKIGAYVERHGSVRPLEECRISTQGINPLPNGTSIAIIGGGLAGPAFARRALMLADKLGIDLRIDLLTRPSCNYCAGLITDVSLKSMKYLYNLEIPPETVKETIEEVVYMNPREQVTIPLHEHLTSVLRTSRFKQQGLDDSWIDCILDGFHTQSNLTVHRNAWVTNVKKKERGGYKITYNLTGSQLTLDADIVVYATGLKSIQQPFMQRLIAEHAYEPPGLMDSSVTEVNTTKAEHYKLSGRVLVVDGLIRNCIVAFVPKGKGWLTITGLGKILADHDMEFLFNQPMIKEFIQLDDVVGNLRCRKICSASVTISPARKFFGDGWVMIGDLTGYGRALKDGFYAALQSADLAATTLLTRGSSRQAFAEGYLKPLRRLAFDNAVGMRLFSMDQRIIGSRMGSALLSGAQEELARDEYGGTVTSAFRGLFTGELSYKQIAALFLIGMVSSPIEGVFRKSHDTVSE